LSRGLPRPELLLRHRSHDHGRGDRQHLLQDVRSDAGLRRSPLRHRTADFLAAEDVAEDPVPVGDRFRATERSEVIDVLRVPAAAQRPQQPLESGRVGGLALETGGQRRQQSRKRGGRLRRIQSELTTQLLDRVVAHDASLCTMVKRSW